MLVCFKVNLGSNDAQPLGLDYKSCGAGMKLEVSDKAGQLLVSKGIASEVAIEAVAMPAEIKGVPHETKPTPMAARQKSHNQSKES
jgi:hypothetical protein